MAPSHSVCITFNSLLNILYYKMINTIFFYDETNTIIISSTPITTQPSTLNHIPKHTPHSITKSIPPQPRTLSSTTQGSGCS